MWTPNFKPEIESTLALVWINLSDLKWNCFEWDALYRIMEPIGIPIIIDKSTLSKTSPTISKLKVEINVTKALLHEVHIDIMNEKGQMESIIQKVEYEYIPEYCNHCKMQGHSDLNAEFFIRNYDKGCSPLPGGLGPQNRPQALETTQERSKEYEGKLLVQERNPNNGTNLVDEYSHFESDLEVEVEETHLSNEIESTSDSEILHLTKMNNILGVNSGKNIRSVRTPSSVERLKTLKNEYNITFISLQEPFVEAEKMNTYMRHLGMQGCHANLNNKIRLFWSNEFDIVILEDSEQQVTCKVSHIGSSIIFHISMAIIGDFNVITDSDEKFGGSPYRIDKSFDFRQCLSECGMQEGLVGKQFTWCNNRGAPDTIWKRLDRMVFNSEWFDLYNGTIVNYLASACSDHVPLLAQFKSTSD
ncbi:uncharacterized protein LOC142169944 [Nicotiana tabacum]|uniref:Uncharacterized protein LOC142169944 n=1 Tax=Nicotiana tabacum TaxID=4097 RepID=A0AC58SSQ8_TOBAC